MTKKQYDELKPFEDSFKEAKAGYYRAILTSDIDKMVTIYEALGFTIESKRCNRCILNMLKNLGAEYDKYELKLTKKNNGTQN